MIEELDTMPELGPLLRRAAAGGAAGATTAIFRKPPPPPLPLETELRVRGVSVDRDHLARYDRVCGFRLGDVLAPTYPHVLAFPLAMDLMTRTTFPFQPLGLVHVANRIEQARPLLAGEVFEVRVRAENLREHERGRAVDVVTVVTAQDTDVWRERAMYLRRRRGGGRAPSEPAPPPEPQATWQVAVEVGSAYARASGDRNPIHTSTLAARLFGFPRRIAHGMWSLARCLAAFEGRVPDECTVDTEFKRPVLLPATVAFASWAEGEARRFALHDAATGVPHLFGVLSPSASQA